MSCTVMRTWLPALRTEPSRMCATFSRFAISGIPMSFPLNENAEEREITRDAA